MFCPTILMVGHQHLADEDIRALIKN